MTQSLDHTPTSSPTHPQRSRSPSTKNIRRDYQVGAKVSEPELLRLRTASAQRGLTLSEWVRESILARVLRPSPFDQLLLDRLTALLRILKVGLGTYGEKHRLITPDQATALARDADTTAPDIAARLLKKIAEGHDILLPTIQHSPVTPSSERRNRSVWAGLTRAEFARAELAAKSQGMTLSAWARDVMLSAARQTHPMDQLLLLQAEALRYVVGNLFLAYTSADAIANIESIRAGVLPQVELLAEAVPTTRIVCLDPIPQQKASDLLAERGITRSYPVLHPHATALNPELSGRTRVRRQPENMEYR